MILDGFLATWLKCPLIEPPSANHTLLEIYKKAAHVILPFLEVQMLSAIIFYYIKILAKIEHLIGSFSPTAWIHQKFCISPVISRFYLAFVAEQYCLSPTCSETLKTGVFATAI